MILFGLTFKQHQNWSSSQCSLVINNNPIEIDTFDDDDLHTTNCNINKMNKYTIVEPLDITYYASKTMDVEITSHNKFEGIIVAEIVEKFSIDQLKSLWNDRRMIMFDDTCNKSVEKGI